MWFTCVPAAPSDCRAVLVEPSPFAVPPKSGCAALRYSSHRLPHDTTSRVVGRPPLHWGATSEYDRSDLPLKPDLDSGVQSAGQARANQSATVGPGSRRRRIGVTGTGSRVGVRRIHRGVALRVLVAVHPVETGETHGRLNGASRGFVSFRRNQHEWSVYALVCLANARRSRGFSPPQRFFPTRALWPCFMPHPPIGFGPSEPCSTRSAVMPLGTRCSLVVQGSPLENRGGPRVTASPGGLLGTWSIVGGLVHDSPGSHLGDIIRSNQKPKLRTGRRAVRPRGSWPNQAPTQSVHSARRPPTACHSAS